MALRAARADPKNIFILDYAGWWLFITRRLWLRTAASALLGKHFDEAKLARLAR